MFKNKLLLEKKLRGIQENTYESLKFDVLAEDYYNRHYELLERKQNYLLHKMQEMVNAQKVKELRDAELEDIKVDTKRDAQGNPIKTDITGVPSVHVTAKPVVSYDPRTNIATSARNPGGPLVQNLRAFNTSIKKYDYRHPNLEESAKKQNQYSHDDLKTLTKHFNHFTDIGGSGQGDSLSPLQKTHFQAHATKTKSLPHELQTQLYTLIKDHVNYKSNHYEDEDKEYLLNIYKPESLIKIKEDQHYCAKHVFSELYGEGVVVEGAHAEPDEDGNVQWYTVEFAHGPEQVYTEDVEIMIAEYHNNHTQSRNTKKKQKKVM